MEIITDPSELNAALATVRESTGHIALVPTMGNIHTGHLELVQRAHKLAEFTVVSIFVNPLQFVEGEDYDVYPRTLDQDCTLLERTGVDAVFAPDVGTLYGQGLTSTTRVEVPALDGILCGKFRPGHFVGVATVVSKLFNLVQPQVAVFGDKDYQQLLLIKQMVTDLCFPVSVVSVPTVREENGLAMSSRNAYLSPQEKKTAVLLYETLIEVGAQLEAGSKDFARLERNAKHALAEGGFKPQYFSVCRAEDLQAPTASDLEFAVLAAAFLGQTRLIDHLEVSVEL